MEPGNGLIASPVKYPYDTCANTLANILVDHLSVKQEDDGHIRPNANHKIYVSGSEHAHVIKFRDVGFALFANLQTKGTPEFDSIIMRRCKSFVAIYHQVLKTRPLYLEREKDPSYPCEITPYGIDSELLVSRMSNGVRFSCFGRCCFDNRPKDVQWESFCIGDVNIKWTKCMDIPILACIIGNLCGEIDLAKDIYNDVMAHIGIDVLVQNVEAYSDWQYTLPRKGWCFYSSLLLWYANRLFENQYKCTIGIQRMKDFFWNKKGKCFHSIVNAKEREEPCLDDHVLLLIIPDAYETFFPGNPTEADGKYMIKNVFATNDLRLRGDFAWQTYPNGRRKDDTAFFKYEASLGKYKQLGIERYHTKTIWSWLLAATGIAMFRAADIMRTFHGKQPGQRAIAYSIKYQTALYTNAYEIANRLCDSIQSLGMTVPETFGETSYDYKTLLPFTSFAYRTPLDSAWGISYTIWFMTLASRINVKQYTTQFVPLAQAPHGTDPIDFAIV